jgi:predicted Zn-dependent protease
MFYHPTLRFQFAVPSGWTVDNTPGSVTLVAADKNGGVIMQGGKTTDSAEDVAKKQATEIANSGGKLLNEKRMTVNGLACFEQSYTIAQQNQPTVQMRRSYLKKGDWVYIFAAMSPADSFSKYETNFQGVVSSFRELTDTSKINRAPKRLALVKANGTDTLQAIFKKAGMPESAWPQFAILNGLEATAVPQAGKLIKVVR